jgi:hypothetical protein
MPEKKTIQRARRAGAQRKKPSAKTGWLARAEIHHKHTGKPRVKSRKQAIAVGLEKSRRARVAAKKPRKAAATSTTRKATRTRTVKSAVTKRRRAAVAAKRPHRATQRRKHAASRRR